MAMDVKNTARTNGAGKIRKVAIITEENGKQDGEHSNIGWTEKEGRRGFVLNADAKQVNLLSINLYLQILKVGSILSSH